MNEVKKEKISYKIDNFLQRTKINADYQQKKYRLTKLSNGNFFSGDGQQKKFVPKNYKKKYHSYSIKRFFSKKVTLTLNFSDFPYFEFFSKTPTIYKLIKLF